MYYNEPFAFEEHHEIKGLYLITPHLFSDNRGDYTKIYEKSIYSINGIHTVFTETSEIISNRGVLRGLHYQTKDSQAKLVHVIKGRIFDVAVDLRPNSNTFGKWVGYELSGTDNKAVFIPEDFAHGFLVLEENTIFSYQCSGIYLPEYCGGIKWDDDQLAIEWPLDGIPEVILSDKDRTQNITLLSYASL